MMNPQTDSFLLRTDVGYARRKTQDASYSYRLAQSSRDTRIPGIVGRAIIVSRNKENYPQRRLELPV